jgi:hypothetical protein
MLNEMPLLSVNKTAKMGSYASFPGSGPSGMFCANCAHQTADRNKFVCGEFKRITGRKGSPICTSSPACKYFEKRRAFNQTVGG